MNGKHLKFFICHLSLGVAGLYSRRADNEFWFY